MLKKIVSLFSRKPESESKPAPALFLEVSRRRILLEKANIALNSSDDEALVEALSVLLKANTRDPEALTLDGLRVFKHRNFIEAANVLALAVDCQTSDNRAAKFLAEALLQTGRFAEGLAASERALAQHPFDSEVLYIRGLLYLKLQDYQNAAIYLNRALENAPRDLALSIVTDFLALEVLGRVHLRQNLVSDNALQARKRLFRQLSAARLKKKLSSLESMAFMALALNAESFPAALEEAERLHAEPITTHDESSFAGYVFMVAGKVDQALEMWAQVGDDISSPLEYSIGIVKAAAGGDNWASGWRIMTNVGSDKVRHRVFRHGLPQWKGERLGKKKLLVYQDQGFGDLLIALRFVRVLCEKGVNVVLMTSTDMRSLLSGAGLDVEVVMNTDEASGNFGCSAAAAVFDLVHFLDLRPEKLKEPVCIKPPKGLSGAWGDILERDSRPRIGFVFTGNPWRQDDWVRSVPVSATRALLGLEDVCWVSLAVDDRKEREEFVSRFGAMDPAQDLKDFSHTAALIEHLDVVVAIDCSVAHLAAAMGKKVLVLAPTVVDWRWKIGRDTAPFWPTAEVYRAEAPAVWDKAVQKLARRLAEICNELRKARLPSSIA